MTDNQREQLHNALKLAEARRYHEQRGTGVLLLVLAALAYVLFRVAS